MYEFAFTAALLCNATHDFLFATLVVSLVSVWVVRKIVAYLEQVVSTVLCVHSENCGRGSCRVSDPRGRKCAFSLLLYATNLVDVDLCWSPLRKSMSLKKQYSFAYFSGASQRCCLSADIFNSNLTKMSVIEIPLILMYFVSLKLKS